MRAERHGVVASVSASSADAGAPQAAIVGVVVSDELEIFFDTLDSTRKVGNLRLHPRAAVVIGSVAPDAKATVQVQGIVDEPRGTDLERLKELYFERFIDGPTRQAWKGLIYMRVRPTWLRVSDYRTDPPHIVELDADELDALK
jgi:hypothetical protein